MRQVICLVVLCAITLAGCREEPHESKTDRKSSLLSLSQQIAALTKKHQQANERHAFVEASRLQLEINYLTEFKDLQDDAQKEELERKYELLRDIFSQEQANLGHPPRRLQKKLDYEQKDVPFRAPDFTSVYHPKVLAEVNRIFKEYGSLYVGETDPERHGGFKGYKAYRPWAGYWYPFSDTSIYKLLEKYEQVLAKSGIKADIVRKEKEIFEGFSTANWEGRCDALALAGILTKEPTEPLTVNGITFGIEEQKGLKVYAYMNYPVAKYGISYEGNAATDGTFQDVKPEAFHKMATIYLKANKPFVVDTVAGVQKWNRSLFSLRVKIVKDPNVKNAFLVRAYPTYIKERREKRDDLTSTDDYMGLIYDYRLYYDPYTKNAEGHYKVIAGQWLGDSFESHPDSFLVPYSNKEPSSTNQIFNNHMEFFKINFLQH